MKAKVESLEAKVATLEKLLERALKPHRNNKGHVSNCAISLHWLVNVFLAKHPEIQSRPYTTSAVTYELIKPAVMEKGCRYVDLIEDESRGRSFFFISHGWVRPFIELVDQLVAHFKPENQAIWRPKGSPILQWHEIYVWLDIFAINQNQGASQKDDLSQLKEVVEDADQTLMILDKEGSVLTRIWCLFEAWHTGKKGKLALKLLAYGVDWEQLEEVFIGLDVVEAKATVIEGRDRILNDIAADVGVLTMTHQLKNALVDSVVSSIPPDDDDHPWNDDLGYELYKAGNMCQLYGGYSDAEPFYRRDLEGCEQVLGPDHAKTITAVGNLALLLKVQDQAEPLYRRALEGCEQAHGPDHPDTLSAVNNLASLLQSEQKLDEAEPLLRRAMKGQERINGPMHSLTLAVVGNLAILLKSQGRLDEAEVLKRRDLDGSEKTLGPKHPDTLTSVTNLAALLYKQGKIDEALPLVERAIEGFELVYGHEHTITIEAKDWLNIIREGKADLESEAAAGIEHEMLDDLTGALSPTSGP